MPLPRLGSPVILAGFVLTGVLDLALPSGWAHGAITAVQAGLLAALVAQSLRRLRRAGRAGAVLRVRALELAFVLGAAALLGTRTMLWWHGIVRGDQLIGPGLAGQYTVAMFVLVALRLAMAPMRLQHVLHRLDLHPTQTVAVGFAGLILAGGLLLSLPFSVNDIGRLSILDALFTATSAVTVTGLVVYDLPQQLSFAGQVVLLVLVQLGGFGTMAATASLLMLAGRRLRLKQTEALAQTMDVNTLGEVGALLRAVFLMTFAIEALGALALWLSFRHLPEARGPFFALFHAVSAFCNAGFSLFPGNVNFIPLATHPLAALVIATLIVLGGLGFPVLRELGAMARRRGTAPRRRLSLHARLVLTTSALLLGVGTVGLALFEWGNAFRPLGWPHRLVAAAFHAVSARTAGFNMVDFATMSPAGLFLMMTLIFVGGSPGGTAGGIKTTTAATVALTLRALLRGRERAEAFGRAIPLEQTAKALALLGVASATLVVALLLLLALEDGEPIDLAFEAVSAFGTTGLSTGITPKLGPAGKMILMLLMFVGRTGPLTLAFAMAARARPARIAYPEEKVMLG